jgi:hypothetical protein
MYKLFRKYGIKTSMRILFNIFVVVNMKFCINQNFRLCNVGMVKNNVDFGTFINVYDRGPMDQRNII